MGSGVPAWARSRGMGNNCSMPRPVLASLASAAHAEVASQELDLRTTASGGQRGSAVAACPKRPGRPQDRGSHQARQLRRDIQRSGPAA